MYNMPRWNNPGRRRKINYNHNCKDYCWYYDLDNDDFEYLVMKLKNNERLTDKENERYGKYIYTIIYIVLCNPKFANKPHEERAELFEQAVFELLSGITTFNPDKGRLYSYSYRICYTAFCHYYTNKMDDAEKRKAIIEHCMEELRDYLEEYTDHKIKRH